MTILLYLACLLAFLLNCGGQPALASGLHHGTERGTAMLHPADHACDRSELRHGDYVIVTEGAFKGMRAKILEKSPSGRHHCHVLVAFPDAHIDVLSVIGVLEIELLRKVQ